VWFAKIYQTFMVKLAKLGVGRGKRSWEVGRVGFEWGGVRWERCEEDK
jgi:hypothetical protein